MADDGTEWDGCLAKTGGDSVYEDLSWSSEKKTVYQRIYQGTPKGGAWYFQSELFSVRTDYAGGLDFPDVFGGVAGAEGGVDCMPACA